MRKYYASFLLQKEEQIKTKQNKKEISDDKNGFIYK